MDIFIEKKEKVQTQLYITNINSRVNYAPQHEEVDRWAYMCSQRQIHLT